MSAVRFLLNGALRAEGSASPTMTVLDWLRTVAFLTGTKEGCAEGDCGACTIALGRLRNGELHYEAVNSCLMMVPQIDGGAVLTVEGLAGVDGTPHPVQRALVDADATQCGFCTPGFVMAMFAFQQGAEPRDDALIHEALAGNLCRCTGYRSIVDACRRLPAASPERSGADAAASALKGLPASDDYCAGNQRFFAPRTLAELHQALAQNPDAVLLAGGTDIGLRVSKGREAIPVVISTAAVAELAAIASDAQALTLGGAVTYTQALPSLDAHFPALAALVRRIGSRQIRNLGTIAGNLATASPIGDMLPSLIALNASVVLASQAGQRSLSVESFITGYRKTALAPGEVIASIRVPLLQPKQSFATYKVAKRFDQDISTVVAAFLLERDGATVRDLRAAYGGMAARAMRAAHLEAALIGRAWSEDHSPDVAAALARDFTPMSDHRGSARYRMRVAAGLLRRFQLETTETAPIRVEAL
jgi:xanthine dehydrogenase small subunit